MKGKGIEQQSGGPRAQSRRMMEPASPGDATDAPQCGPLPGVRTGSWVGVRGGFGLAQVVKWKKGRYRVRWPPEGDEQQAPSERSVFPHQIEPAAPPDVVARCPEGAGAVVITGAPVVDVPARGEGVDINGEYLIDVAKPVVNGWPSWCRKECEALGVDARVSATRHISLARPAGNPGRLVISVSSGTSIVNPLGHIVLGGSEGTAVLPTGSRTRVHGCMSWTPSSRPNTSHTTSHDVYLTLTSAVVPAQTGLLQEAATHDPITISRRTALLKEKRTSGYGTPKGTIETIGALKTVFGFPWLQQGHDERMHKLKAAHDALRLSDAKVDVAQADIRQAVEQCRQERDPATMKGNVLGALVPARDELRQQFAQATTECGRLLLPMRECLAGVAVPALVLEATSPTATPQADTGNSGTSAVSTNRADVVGVGTQPWLKPSTRPGAAARAARQARLGKIQKVAHDSTVPSSVRTSDVCLSDTVQKALEEYCAWQESQETAAGQLAAATDRALQQYVDRIQECLLGGGSAQALELAIEQLLRTIKAEEEALQSTDQTSAAVLATQPIGSCAQRVCEWLSGLQFQLEIWAATVDAAAQQVERMGPFLAAPQEYCETVVSVATLQSLQEDHEEKEDARDEARLRVTKAARRKERKRDDVRWQQEFEDARTAEDLARTVCNTAGRAYYSEKARLMKLARDHLPELPLLYPELDLCDVVEGLSLAKPWLTFSSFESPTLMAESGDSRHKVFSTSLDGKPCVLKEYVLVDGVALARLRKEARFLQRLSHPCIVELFGVVVDESETTAYLHMRQYAGGNLRQWLDGSQAAQVDVSERQSIVHEILEGIQYLHANKVVHCDIKPANIFLTADVPLPHAVLGDFDISRDLAALTSTLTRTSLAGTAVYMAPELHDATAQPTPASDMFAVGVTLLLLLEFSIPTTVSRKQIVQFCSRWGSSTICPTATDKEQLVRGLLAETADQRLTASEALRNPYVSATAAHARARMLRRDSDHQLTQLAAAKTVEEQLKTECARRAATTQPPAYWEAQDVESLVCSSVSDNALRTPFTTLLRDCVFIDAHHTHASGCGPDIPGLSGATVTRVVRVENMRLWKKYCHKKAELLLQHGDSHDASLRRDSTAVQQIVQLRRRIQGILPGGAQISALEDAPLSDLFLFHGTDPETAQKIARAGFDERVASDKGLYGMGSYFTNHTCKAHQYTGYLSTARQPVLTQHGEHCMLLARVQLGAVYRTERTHPTERRPPLDPAHGGGAVYDSILAESGRANKGQQVHHEVVVFRSEQVYPEFILYYTV